MSSSETTGQTGGCSSTLTASFRVRDILFVNPPNHASAPAYPMGIGTLHAIALEHGFDSQILDLQNQLIREELTLGQSILSDIREQIRAHPAKVFGITIMNTSYPWALLIIPMIRECHPEAKVIVGGPHATVLDQRIYEECSGIDAICMYEGERVIVPLLEALLDGDRAALKCIGNLCLRDENGEVFWTEAEPLVEDLDALPSLVFDLVEYDGGVQFVIEAGRGCAYNCYFCSTNYIWKKLPRFKSARKIVDEVMLQYDALRAHRGGQTTLFYLEHDNFLMGKNILEELIEIKQEERLGFAFGCSARITHIDDKVIAQLIRANCRYLFFGIETGSQRIQKVACKNIKLETVLPTVKKICDHGIFVEANFIVGFPEETMDEALATLQLMAELRWSHAFYCLVDVAYMSPGPRSALAKKTSLDQYVLNTSSDFYRELRASGISPEGLDKFNNNHLYTIANDDYDVLKMVRFAKFWRNLLRYFPATSFVMCKGNGYGVDDVAEIFWDSYDHCESEHDVRLPVELLRRELSGPGLSGAYDQLLAYEITRMNATSAQLVECDTDVGAELPQVYAESAGNLAGLLSA